MDPQNIYLLYIQIVYDYIVDRKLYSHYLYTHISCICIDLSTHIQINSNVRDLRSLRLV